VAVPRRRSRADRRRPEYETPSPIVERRQQARRDVQIKQRVKANILIVALENEIVAENFHPVQEALQRVVNVPQIARIIVNMKKVPFVDSMAIGILLEMHQLFEKAGKKMLLMNVVPQVRLFIETLMLDTVFNIREG
jgi:anti-anti-sigma factor